ILHLICEHSESTKDLASLAMTCKDFEEPTSNVLWSKINGFYPLAKCLPSNTWLEEVREDNNQYIVSAR
ncbi:hypothetical protein BDQ17DRAFT_1266756, partial [Cyathus striatus]